MTPERFAKLRATLDQRQTDLTVLMENAQKSHNVSAVLRTSDAVGLYEIHAVAESGALRRHHMISGGSRKWVRLRRHADMASALGSLRERSVSITRTKISPLSVLGRTKV